MVDTEGCVEEGDDDIVDGNLVEELAELVVEFDDLSVDEVDETPFWAAVTLTPESPSHIHVSALCPQAVLPSTAVLQVKLPLTVPEQVTRLAHWSVIAIKTEKYFISL